MIEFQPERADLNLVVLEEFPQQDESIGRQARIRVQEKQDLSAGNLRPCIALFSSAGRSAANEGALFPGDFDGLILAAPVGYQNLNILVCCAHNCNTGADILFLVEGGDNH